MAFFCSGSRCVSSTQWLPPLEGSGLSPFYHGQLCLRRRQAELSMPVSIPSIPMDDIVEDPSSSMSLHMGVELEYRRYQSATLFSVESRVHSALLVGANS